MEVHLNHQSLSIIIHLASYKQSFGYPRFATSDILLATELSRGSPASGSFMDWWFDKNPTGERFGAIKYHHVSKLGYNHGDVLQHFGRLN